MLRTQARSLSAGPVIAAAKHLYESAGFVEVKPFNNEPYGTIGSRKTSDASHSDAYAPQRSAAGNYLGDRAARRFAGTLLRLLVTGFLVLAGSNNCRMPCSNSSTALSKAPSCPTRTIATDKCSSNDGGRNTSTVPVNSFLAIKRAGSSPIPYPD